MKSNKSKILSNGIITSNPVFRLVLGTCPTLAVTTSAFNGLGMGLAATLVLVCSNALVSLLRKVIPDKVRIPCFVLIIATFVTLVEMLLRRFIPALYSALGIYLPLIVVNCIILARAEAFASTNTVGDSILDGLGMGLGFTLSLMTMGFIRELVGSGTVFVGSLGETEFGLVLGNLPDYALSVFVMPAGGFLVFGLLMALINWLTDKSEQRKKEKLIAEAERIEDMKRYIAAMEAVDADNKVENLEGEEVEA
jgi:electron transport complex protein RnfE